MNLFNYTETTSFNKLIYWIMFLSLIVVGAVKIVLTQCKIEKGQNIVTGCSMILSILTVLFLAMAKEAYAITLVFILLIIKGMLLFKHSKNA